MGILNLFILTGPCRKVYFVCVFFLSFVFGMGILDLFILTGPCRKVYFVCGVFISFWGDMGLSVCVFCYSFFSIWNTKFIDFTWGFFLSSNHQQSFAKNILYFPKQPPPQPKLHSYTNHTPNTHNIHTPFKTIIKTSQHHEVHKV